MLHVRSIFVWIMIKMQWLPLILNGKGADKALFFYMKRFILFVFFIYFIWGIFLNVNLVVICIYIIFLFCLSKATKIRIENRSNQSQQKSNNMKLL